jgi:hypothetical protein
MSDEPVKIENEITISDYSPQGLISQALAQNLPVATLEKLMDLADRWESKQAKVAFTKAMSEFQKECPIIRKRKDGNKTKSGIVAFKYAPIEHILTEKNKNGETVQELISKNGFSYIIKTPSFTADSVTVDVEIRHISGHSEISSVTMPLVNKTEMMSAPQVVAGTITLCKRYSFCDGFGIITGEPDLDGMKLPNKPKESIPEPQEKVDWGKLIKSCESIKELKAIWKRMNEAEQNEHREAFNKIKSNIESATKTNKE